MTQKQNILKKQNHELVVTAMLIGVLDYAREHHVVISDIFTHILTDPDDLFRHITLGLPNETKTTSTSPNHIKGER